MYPKVPGGKLMRVPLRLITEDGLPGSWLGDKSSWRLSREHRTHLPH